MGADGSKNFLKQLQPPVVDIRIINHALQFSVSSPHHHVFLKYSEGTGEIKIAADRRPSKHCLKTSSQRRPSTLCGSAFHCQIALNVKQLFLMFAENLICHNLNPLHQVLLSGAVGKNLAPSL